MANKSRWRQETILQHGKYDPKEHRGHLNPPLYLDIASVQPSIEEAAERFQDADNGFTYDRKGHENGHILEMKLAALEGGEDALVFSSGMAATNCLLLELVKSGKNLVTHRCMYGGTLGFLNTDFKEAGRGVDFVRDPMCIQDWGAVIFRSTTAAVFIEMPSNPIVSLFDFVKILNFAKERGVPVIVDNTFAPLLFSPLKWGADFILRSGSKYENPGNTNLLGFVIGPKKALNAIRNGRYERLGAGASAFDCWLADLGTRTLKLRMVRQSNSALEVAKFLNYNPRVNKVHYPGLPGSPYHELQQKYMPQGCGAVLAIELRGGFRECKNFIEGLRIFSHVVNLGDTRSLVTYPAYTTHSKMPREKRLEAGISDTLLRLSIGLEDVDDLITDLNYALAKI